MFRPIIVVAQLLTGELVGLYLGTDADAAEKTFSAAGENADVNEVALYYYPQPRQVRHPASEAQVLEVSRSMQRDLHKENVFSSAKAAAIARLTDETRREIEARATAEAEAAVAAGAVQAVANQVVAGAIANAITNLAGGSSPASEIPPAVTSAESAPAAVAPPVSPNAAAAVPPAAAAEDAAGDEESDAKAHFGGAGRRRGRTQ